MSGQYVFGKRLFKPYIVNEKDYATLRRRLKKETKVKAVIVSVQNDGYLTQQQIADLVGITRMTLFRWRTTDKKFQREIERLNGKAATHYRNESRKQRRKITWTVDDIIGNERLYRFIML